MYLHCTSWRRILAVSVLIPQFTDEGLTTEINDIQHVGSYDVKRGLLPFGARRTLRRRACCRPLRRSDRRPAPLEMLLEAYDLYMTFIRRV